MVIASTIPFYVNASTTNGDFCGGTFEGSGRVDRVEVWPSGNANCVGKKTAGLATILVHELSHVLGWDASHGGDPARSSSLTNTGCTTFIPKPSEGGGISGSVCYHDVEAILRAQIGSGSMSSSTYFSQPILSGTNVTPRSVALPEGTDATFTLTSWLAQPFGSASQTNSSVTWSSDNTSDVTVTQAGVATGVDSGGSAKLFLKGKSGSVPSGYHLWSGFALRGDSVTVTVTGPPPFKVDSIWANPQPFTSPGWAYMYSAVSNAPSGTLKTRWIITDSRTPSVSDTVEVAGTTHYMNIAAGSYTLSFDVQPFIVGGAEGFRAYQSIPVCTGEALLGGGKSGGETTLVPEGCSETEY